MKHRTEKEKAKRVDWQDPAFWEEMLKLSFPPWEWEQRDDIVQEQPSIPPREETRHILVRGKNTTARKTQLRSVG